MKSNNICDMCGEKGVRIQKVTRTYGKGSRLLVIEHVPVMVCPNCGESYMTADVVHSLERIKLHRQGFAKTRPVAVASFA